MGQIAEDMLDGSCCQHCGRYFIYSKYKGVIYAHDYPVTCWECWDDLSEQDKKKFIKADVITF